MWKTVLLILSLFLLAGIKNQAFAIGFGGGIFDDPIAKPAGLGGTDSRCTGSTAQEVSGVGFKIRAFRTGENVAGKAIGSTYSVNTYTHNGDYTVIVNLPYPPPDPANAWQCACNANPSDAYQCVFTNQDPDTVGPINIFVKRANVENNAWWQLRGGSVYSAYNVQSLVPVSLSNTPGYCNTTAACLPALIGSDWKNTLDSPGFAFSTDGLVHTHQIIGTNFIHDAAQRSTDLQSSATGFDLPTDNYNTFYKKIGRNALVLPSSQKPVSATQPGIYVHEGSLTIGAENQWHVGAGEQLIVLVTGDLTIDDTPGAENRLITVARGGFLAFFVQGTIVVTPHVGYANIFTDSSDPAIPVVEGVFVADDTFWVQSYVTAPDKKFIGAGTFVGWGGVNLQRSFAAGNNNSANNVAPTETFVFRPDLLVNTPAVIKSPQVNIREIQPQTFTP